MSRAAVKRIDPCDERIYIESMPKKKNSVFDSTDMKQLEASLDGLVRLCECLQQENSVLRNDQMQLKSERTMLIKKNEISRKRMEAIIMRLKSMELEI